MINPSIQTLRKFLHETGISPQVTRKMNRNQILMQILARFDKDEEYSEDFQEWFDTINYRKIFPTKKHLEHFRKCLALLEIPTKQPSPKVGAKPPMGIIRYVEDEPKCAESLKIQPDKKIPEKTRRKISI